MIVPKAGKVLCVGRLYCDLVFSGVPKMPVVGEEVFAKKLSTHAGGCTKNLMWWREWDSNP